MEGWGAGGRRQSSGQQGLHDTESIICFSANQAATVRTLRLKKAEEKKRGEDCDIFLTHMFPPPISTNTLITVHMIEISML